MDMNRSEIIPVVIPVVILAGCVLHNICIDCNASDLNESVAEVANVDITLNDWLQTRGMWARGKWYSFTEPIDWNDKGEKSELIVIYN